VTRTRTGLAVLALSVSLSLPSVACGPPELPACFPASSAVPADESEGGFSRTTLKWEIDKMAALVDVPDSDAPPSEVFLNAQRDMRTEFYQDAAKGFLHVVRGDTSDGKKIRYFAQYDLAMMLFRLRYFEEARRVFRMIAEDHKHPRTNEADAWMQRKTCTG